MTPAVIAKIISMQPSFTVGENEIAQYVVQNVDKVISSTISAVARDTGTSEASVNRFCKKIGYKGFNSLKIALARESVFNQMNTAPPAGGNYLASLSQDYQRILLNTTAMLDEAQLIEVTEAMKAAHMVYIFALAETRFAAEELADKLSLVGLRSKAITEISEIRIAASHIKKSDVAVFINATIYVRDIFPALTLCNERGAKVVAITSYDSPEIKDQIDYKIITSDTITAQNAVTISNNIIFLYVVDVLFGLMLSRDKALREKKLGSDAIRNSNQSMDTYLYGY